MQVVTVDTNCGSAPAFDKYYVYYQGGRQRNELWRRRKDCNFPAEMIDPHCGSTPAVDDDYVYFQGGKNRDQLHRKKKDGSQGTQILDKQCAAMPVIDDIYVYYLSGDRKNRLMRRLKDGSEEAELLEDNCVYPPVLDGDNIYFVGGHTDTTLYCRSKYGSGNKFAVNTTCLTRPALDDTAIYYIQGSNSSNGTLVRQNKTTKQTYEHNKRIDIHAASVTPAVLTDYVLFQGSANLVQLSAKAKDGKGAVIRLADYCGSAPVVDVEDRKVYFLSSTTFHVLMSISLPSYVN